MCSKVHNPGKAVTYSCKVLQSIAKYCKVLQGLARSCKKGKVLFMPPAEGRRKILAYVSIV